MNTLPNINSTNRRLFLFLLFSILLLFFPVSTHAESSIVTQGAGTVIPSYYLGKLTALGDAVGEGAIAMAILGRDKTTAMAMRLTNKTEDPMSVVVPTGTPLEPKSKDHQPYQTGYIPPIELEPGETKTVEVPAFCTDSEKEPAPADGSVTYTLQKGPLTPEQEKITEIIVVTNTLRLLHETCGKVAEPDDFLFAGGPPPLTVPMPEEVPKPSEPLGPPEPEPEVYGPPPPPEKPGPEEYGPPPPPEKPEPEEDEFAPLPPPEAGPLPGWLVPGPEVTLEEWINRVIITMVIIKEGWSYGLGGPFSPQTCSTRGL